jgi:hypothetical protein
VITSYEQKTCLTLFIGGIGSAVYHVDPRVDVAQEQRQTGMFFTPPIGGKFIRKLTLFEYRLTSTIAPPGANTYYENPYQADTYNIGYAHGVDGLGSVSPTYPANLARKSPLAVIDGVLDGDIIIEDQSLTGPPYASGYTHHATLAPPAGGESIVEV